MFVRWLARASSLPIALVGTLLAVLMPSAQAAPPRITGTPVTAQMPNISDLPITINLRELGVIDGSAPLVVSTTGLQIFDQAGAPTGLIPTLFPNNGPGRVCITIANNGNFTVGPGQTFQLRLTVTNLANDTAGPITVPVTNTPGNVVDTTPEQAACDDRNNPPTADAGPDQILNDTDGRPGETVILNGAASSDPDPGTVLLYQWFEDGEFSLGEETSTPTLSARHEKLACGTPSTTTLLGLDEVTTQRANFIDLKAQSVPFFSASVIENSVPLTASSVRSATAAAMAGMAIVKVKVNGCRT